MALLRSRLATRILPVLSGPRITCLSRPVSYLTDAHGSIHPDQKHRQYPSLDPVNQERLEPEPLLPLACDATTFWGTPSNPCDAPDLVPGSTLKVVSWNLKTSGQGSRVRASAALSYLSDLFSKSDSHLVIMLQDIRPECLQPILTHSFVRSNFCISNMGGPASPPHGDAPCSWVTVPHFNMLLISKSLPIANCFRLPFTSKQAREAIVVDIPIFDPLRGSWAERNVIRLCTTHLETSKDGQAYRLAQLATVSSLLKGAHALGNTVVAGLVGGDMNPVLVAEHEYNKDPMVNLKDVWEDSRDDESAGPVAKKHKKMKKGDPTYGRAKGHTWGYHSRTTSAGRRLAKFFYTGRLATFPVTEAQDFTGKPGRLGIGCKTSVQHSNIPCPGYRVKPEEVGTTLKKDQKWVSDHFGIVVGIRVL